MPEDTIAGISLVFNEEDEHHFQPRADIWLIMPSRIDPWNPSLPESWCLYGMAVELEGNYKQRLQFFMPVYEAERYAGIVEASGLIPAVVCCYGIPMLVWVFNHKPNEAECFNILKTYLLRLERAGFYSHRSEFPRIDHGCYTVKYWKNMMEWHQFESVVFRNCAYLQENYTDFAHFLRATNNNVYSLWKPGEVPQEAIVNYRLKARHLCFRYRDSGIETDSVVVEETE